MGHLPMDFHYTEHKKCKELFKCFSKVKFSLILLVCEQSNTIMIT